MNKYPHKQVRVRGPYKKDFINKRIVDINTECANVWKIRFDDGSLLKIGTDTYTQYNLPILEIWK